MCGFRRVEQAFRPALQPPTIVILSERERDQRQRVVVSASRRIPIASRLPRVTGYNRAMLDRNQWRGFWAAWAGWTLDGMDSFIYALVMTPAMTELLPRSGIAVSQQFYYGGLLFALFLVGWGCAFLWGPLADRFGRVRMLMATVVWYSVFTFAGALATNIWQLAAFRFLAGIGIGGEWAMGGTFIAESWPEERRAHGAAWMHTGYYVGVLLAALANATIGAQYGWRAMFLLGGTPALIVGWIRHGVTEPDRWKRTTETSSKSFRMLFSRELRVRTLLNTVYVFISIVGLWAGSVYVPTAVMQLAIRTGATLAQAVRAASEGTIILSIATVFGCIVLPPLAARLGRKGALALYFVLMLVFVALGFGYVFYLPSGLGWFLVCLVFIGLGGASFAVYTLWLPEQFPTACRASAFAFATSVGRFGGAGITYLVGAGVTHFHSLGTPVALTAIAFAVGLLLLPFGVETRGQQLPE